MLIASKRETIANKYVVRDFKNPVFIILYPRNY